MPDLRPLKVFVGRYLKDYLLGYKYPRLYAAASAAPVDERKVIFVEGKLGEMTDSFISIIEFLETRYDYDIEFVALEQAKVGFRRYVRNCEALVQKLATAKYVFLNDASDVVSCLPLRPETKVVQLWHACGAFKKWGMSTADLKFGGAKRDLFRHPFYRNLSLVTVSSPEVEWAYCEAMDLKATPDVVKAVGVSRTDVFFDAAFLQASRERIEAEFPACKGKKALLYAPTFRGRVKTAAAPDAMDLPAMKQALGDECVLLVKHHPFVKKLPSIPEGCEDFAFQATHLPIDQLLAASDVCITDYSSIVFEYSLLNRPMVFFPYDIEEYRDWRGFYYDYDELTPGPVVHTSPELVDCLAHLDEHADMARVEAFRKRFMGACDGRSTERICQMVFDDLDSRVKRATVDRMKALTGAEGCDVSIVVPAHNAADTLPRAIESVLAQTYPLSRMELIVVDDGSDDGTWDVLRLYAQKQPSLLKPLRRGEASGSPSAPRNEGLAAARGEYVFFLDADDWLGEQAVERMLMHALDWDSDVLLVKLRGEDGRDVPRSMFGYSQAAADIYRSKVMWSFGPYKLYRRSLTEGLEFPLYMPEDIGFVLRAYVKAKVVSVAADYDYYHLTCDSNAGNISERTWDDVAVNLVAYRDLFGFIAANVPDSERDWALMRRLFKRDVCRTLIAIASEDDALAEAHFQEIRTLVLPFYREDAYRALPPEHQRLLLAAFGRDASLEAIRCAL